jgi:hypothetical protein
MREAAAHGGVAFAGQIHHGPGHLHGELAEYVDARRDAKPDVQAQERLSALRCVFEAEWPWLDVERGCLTLPDSKTGAKTITLSAAALKLILELPRLEGCRWIFPSTKTDRPFVNFNAQWKPVLERAGVGTWRLHDLRHGFASAAVENGAPLHVVGQQLGHARPATTNRYAHVGENPRRATAELVASLLLSGQLHE